MTKEEIDELLEGVEMPEPVATVTNNFRSDYSEIGRTYEAPIAIGTKLVTADQLRSTVAAAVLREREACAKVCEDMWGDDGDADDFSGAIRNRSKA